ncbi:polymeric immunoglobulin receptor-like isoform X3 [Pygocentrus nattereri]|uniref:polymeric immunoglobulin receptor-like isoform X3 n=1 Tax=Pygocentrus nattereri TaxID=42514 RepID=UPI0018910922|nr:polymeric immunoglobulin receptor-like isoform X3 [Pygocentrus nattereri]
MKVLLLILTLYLTSGPVDCAEVTGYTGGRVLINCKYGHTRYMNHTKYFCKISRGKCTDKILSKTQNTSDHERRVFFVNETLAGIFSVLIKNVSLQDGGTYRCGVEDPAVKPTDVTLQVKEDPCCGKTLTQEAHPGDTVTFTCEYPQESKYLSKYVYKATDHNYSVVIYTLGLSTQNGRFSLFDYQEENLFNVSISDVTEEDGGVYLCGVQGRKQGDLNPYYSLFNEIQLQVTASSITTIIIVGVCVALLLIGGSALIVYKLTHKKTRDSASSSSNRRNTVNSDDVPHTPFYEEIPDTRATSTVYATTQDPGPHTAANRSAHPPTAPPVKDIYPMAQLSHPAAESSAEYATVDLTT